MKGLYSEKLGLSDGFYNQDERVGYWVSQAENGNISPENLEKAFQDSLDDENWTPFVGDSPSRGSRYS